MPALDAEAQIDKNFTDLFDAPKASTSLRSSVQQRQKRAADACEEDLKHSRSQLREAQQRLQQLNDSPRFAIANISPSETRADLHDQVTTLEQTIRNQNRECEHDIPSSFAIELAKARLAEKWPQRREKLSDAVKRKHGDIQDIGFRNVGGGLEGQMKDLSAGSQAIRQMKFSGMMPAETQDTNTQRYVQSLARRIASASDLKIPLTVTVLDTPDIDAMGLPGGYLFVTSGLLRACESEDELAGVLAREIAHIAARHGAKSSKRNLLTKALVPVAKVVTGIFIGAPVNAGTYYGLTYGFQGLESLVDHALIGSSNAAQKEADQLGIQYAWNAGFDPKGYIQFLDSLARQRDFSRSKNWFQLKPSLEKRLLDEFTEIHYLPARESRSSSSADFESALRK